MAAASIGCLSARSSPRAAGADGGVVGASPRRHLTHGLSLEYATMSDPVLPSIFVSHGAPTLALDPGATGAFWERLAKELPRPRGILAVSAHWTTPQPMLTGAAKLDTIHDFYGFPEPLYRIFYRPPGAPELAEKGGALLAANELPAAIEPTRGLDHGAWVPLKSMYPAADLPV